MARPPAAAAKRRILFEGVLACFDKERIRYVDCFEEGWFALAKKVSRLCVEKGKRREEWKV